MQKNILSFNVFANLPSLFFDVENAPGYIVLFVPGDIVDVAAFTSAIP
jgi:hypothetical protein